jgi:hypothetical protein
MAKALAKVLRECHQKKCRAKAGKPSSVGEEEEEKKESPQERAGEQG